MNSPNIALKTDDKNNKVLLWHRRFGHIGQQKLFLFFIILYFS
jgi:hypothetical protein